MHLYRAYDLNIASEIVLNGLAEIDGEPDVSVSFGDLSQIDLESLNGGDRVLGNLPERGHFLIQQGRDIVVDPVPGVDDACLAPSVLGPAMAILLRQRGLFVLHASCVAIDGEAIAFVGGSGWGKSTLAKAFHHEGYLVLTDDVMAIRLGLEGPIVIPSFPLFKLSPEATKFFEIQPPFVAPLFPHAPKLACQVHDSFQGKPLPLSQIYVLANGPQHQILPLSHQETFAELVRHTRGIGLLTAPAFTKDHLHQCTHLIKAVSAYRCQRKVGLDELPSLVTLVQQNLPHRRLETADSSLTILRGSHAIAAP